MTSCDFNTSVTVGLLLVVSSLPACQSKRNKKHSIPKSVDCDRTSSDPTHSSRRDGGSSDDATRETDSDGSAFSKPDEYEEWTDPRRGLRPPGGSNLENEERRSTSYRARDYERYNPETNEIWLHEGEPVVFDFGTWWNSSEQKGTLETEVLVFVDFKPVPFALHRIEGEPGSEEFPDVEEAVRTGTFQTSYTVDIPPDTIKSYTIAIRPESLGAKGTHDVRLAWFDQRGPGESNKVRGRFSRGWKLNVNYAGTRFVARSDVPTRNTDPRIPPKSMVKTLDRAGTILVPPGWSKEDITFEANADEIARVEEQTMSLTSWMRGSQYKADLPMATALLDGTRLIDDSLERLTLPKRPETSGRNWSNQPKRPSEPYAEILRTEVSLNEDGMHELRRFVFAHPFCRNNGYGNYVSNSVFIKKIPK